MNFLGHLFLTPDDDELLLGNFIADSVKGDPFRKYPDGIAKGIMLHRSIDQFTDRHPLVRRGVDRLRQTQGRYAPVVIDVIYDHILASEWDVYHTLALTEFAEKTYRKLEAMDHHFPPRVEQFFPYMKRQNWLVNYSSEWGLERSLMGLDRRVVHETEMHRSIEVFREFPEEFRSEFRQFIRDAQQEVSHHLSSGL